MTIYIRPANTQLGPTLMGRILPGPINYRVEYRLKKKKTRSRSGFHSYPDPDPTHLRVKYEITPSIYIVRSQIATQTQKK